MDASLFRLFMELWPHLSTLVNFRKVYGCRCTVALCVCVCVFVRVHGCVPVCMCVYACVYVCLGHVSRMCLFVYTHSAGAHE